MTIQNERPEFDHVNHDDLTDPELSRLVARERELMERGDANSGELLTVRVDIVERSRALYGNPVYRVGDPITGRIGVGRVPSDGEVTSGS